MTNSTFRNLIALCLKVIGIAALCVGLFFLNAFAGNPVSAVLARGAVHRYLDQEYAHLDVRVEKVGYNLKNTNYYAKIVSPTSPDTRFSVYISMLGQVEWDTYAHVTEGFATWDRLNDAYFQAVKATLWAPDFPYTVHLANGDFRGGYYNEYPLPNEGLVVDGEYDLAALGREHGSITLYIIDEDISSARAEEILRDTARRLKEAGITFRGFDFVLQKPRPADGPLPADSPQIRLYDIPYEDIYGESFDFLP